MSDWTELTETHGMTAGTPDAIDRLIDIYSDEEEDYSDRPKCIVCGEPCPPHDSGFVYDAGHKAYYIMLEIEEDEWEEGVHPWEITVPLRAHCWENAQRTDAKKAELHEKMRVWYQANKEE